MTSVLDITTSTLYIADVPNPGVAGMNRISKADALADLRRVFRWRSWLAGLVAVACFAIAFWQLGRPDVDSTARLMWVLLPLPALAWAVWEQFGHHRRLDEFHRTVNARAAEIAWPLTLAWLALVALLATAFGFPIAIPAPFGLPADELGWLEVLLIPLLLHMLVFVLVHKRLSGQR